MKSLSRFRRGNFARLFAALKHFKNLEKIPRGLSLKSRKALEPPGPYTKAVKCKEVRAEELPG